MAQLKFGSAGVTAREIDISGPVTQQPTGIPAGIVGTAVKGPAFVPVTVGNMSDWTSKFGPTDGKKFGPMAVNEWLRNATSVTYLRTLGAGDGLARDAATGHVNSAGFVVGEELPGADGSFASNPSAAAGGGLGRLYFLGCFMSESAGSKVFSDAGIQPTVSAIPIIRGVVMAPSGVLLRLSSSVVDSAAALTTAATEAASKGGTMGDVVLNPAGVPKQEFVLLLNGHLGANATYPNAVTASFDALSNNYFARTLNSDPLKIQDAGHCLYANWDIHPVLASVTGAGVMSSSFVDVAGVNKEHIAFLITSSLARNVGSAYVPAYENFEDRFGHASTPWFTSQKFGGFPQNLFKLHALDDGAGVSNLFKVSIENIVPSSDPLDKYGSFTVVLRQWSDRDLDKKPLAKEVFAGVNLNPASDRYIAKVIGDVHAYYDFDREESEQKLVIEGDYENHSNYVRVEVHPDVANGFVDPTALPMGFRGINHLVTSGSSPLAVLASEMTGSVVGANANVLKGAVTPPLPFRSKVTIADEWTPLEQVETKFYWGAQFEHPETLTKKNTNATANASLSSFAKYFPLFDGNTANFVTGSNAGQPDTAEWGVIDSDRFCNNAFSLENVQVITGSNGLANPNLWKKAIYVRAGNPGNGSAAYTSASLGTDADKARGLQVKDLTSTANRTYAKFTTLLQGGFDGVNIFNDDEAKINNAAVTYDMDYASRGAERGPNVMAYMKAIEVMKNTVNVDIQLFAIPGIRHEMVTDAATLAVEDRFDAMYVMDVQQLDENGEYIFSDSAIPSVGTTLQAFKDRGVDSSFGAAYFPDVLYRDPVGVNVFAPPSVLVMGALALNDSVGHPWFAPAGFTRGALPTAALEARVKLSQQNMDSLYDASINPLVAFPSATGLVVWGQKTLQVAASALDRVNVRRLLIDIRRQVRDIAQTILFEPNRASTLARFTAAVTPRLQRIQAQAGLERFRVIIDSSTTTQADVENNTIRGKIFVQPTKSIEFVSLDFVVTNTVQQ